MTCTSGYTSCSQASSDTWNPGWGEAWAVSGAHEWAAIAAAGPILSPKQWWPTEPDELDNETPAGALQRVAQNSIDGQVRVHL